VRPFILSFVLLLGSSGAANAQWTVPQRIDLGGGLAVERLCAPPTVRSRSCLGWAPTGFVFGDASRWLLMARTFARVPATGRILAVPERPADATSPTWMPRLLRSDDAGQHWMEISWSGSPSPTAFAFDNRTRDGVATGDGGHVWSTGDAGDHWTDHGGDARSWASIAIADGEIVLADSLGNVFRSHDGGFGRETVVTGGARVVLEQRDREITVRTDTTACTVRRGSATMCVDR
jgi:hypothetical protein